RRSRGRAGSCHPPVTTGISSRRKRRSRPRPRPVLPSLVVKGRGGQRRPPRWILGYRVLGRLGEVELRLPDEARVLGLRSAHAGGVLDGLVAQTAVDDVDGDDLEARVAV